MYASQIWEKKFLKNPLSKQSGHEMWNNMLQYGASKDPQVILDSLLDGDKLDPTYFIKSLQK